MITFTQKGDWSNTTRWLDRLKKTDFLSLLDRYGQEGVAALSAATPVDSGITADSWSYNIRKNKDTATIYWTNTNVNNGVPIAILIQYGHVTKNGGYVQGRDFINPALLPIFDKIAQDITEEVRR